MAQQTPLHHNLGKLRFKSLQARGSMPAGTALAMTVSQPITRSRNERVPKSVALPVLARHDARRADAQSAKQTPTAMRAEPLFWGCAYDRRHGKGRAAKKMELANRFCRNDIVTLLRPQLPAVSGSGTFSVPIAISSDASELR